MMKKHFFRKFKTRLVVATILQLVCIQPVLAEYTKSNVSYIGGSWKKSCDIKGSQLIYHRIPNVKIMKARCMIGYKGGVQVKAFIQGNLPANCKTARNYNGVLSCEG